MLICIGIAERVCISSPWLCIDTSSIGHRSTCVTTAYQSLKLSVDSICDPPLVITDPAMLSRHIRSSGFAVAGPTFWNSLADELRTFSSDRLKAALQTSLRHLLAYIQRIRGIATIRYKNSWLTLIRLSRAYRLRNLRPSFFKVFFEMFKSILSRHLTPGKQRIRETYRGLEPICKLNVKCHWLHVSMCMLFYFYLHVAL